MNTIMEKQKSSSDNSLPTIGNTANLSPRPHGFILASVSFCYSVIVIF